MARKKRQTNVFSLSFLDCMSCGFGAVVLFFMIINHATEVRSDAVNEKLLAEVSLLERQVLDGERHKVELRNSIDEVDKESAITEGLSAKVLSDLEVIQEQLADLDALTVAQREHINKLKSDLKTIDEEKKRLEGARASEDDEGGATRSFVGQGDRQYLTGLKVGGERILILVDGSASMLDSSIVNIIRRRNMSDPEKLKARKWQRTINAVDWLSTQIPVESKFQIYTFNTGVQASIPDTLGDWVEVDSGRNLNAAIDGVKSHVPAGGTSLHAAFAAARALKPMPDNIYLLTDSLPTQGASAPRRTTVNGKNRIKHFEEAVATLPLGIPVNIILLPMEGDPMASAAFWQLAQVTGGSFMSPSKDWP